MDVPDTALRMESIVKSNLNQDQGAIIAFPGEIFELAAMRGHT